MIAAVDLGLAQPNRSVSGMNRQRLAATIHFSANLRLAECAFDGDRNSQTDVAISRRRIDIGLEVARQH